jgi:curli biogenesis system outer membrane secretion channel CsgG
MREEEDGAIRPWQRLRHDVLDAPAVPLGSHLEDEVFVAYSMGALSADALAAADAHLAACERCATELERLLLVSAAWQGPAAERRLDEASRRIVQAFERAAHPAGVGSGLKGQLRRLVSRPAFPAGSPRFPWPAFATAAAILVAVSGGLVIWSAVRDSSPDTVPGVRQPAAVALRTAAAPADQAQGSPLPPAQASVELPETSAPTEASVPPIPLSSSPLHAGTPPIETLPASGDGSITVDIAADPLPVVAAAPSTDIDRVIALVQGGMSEGAVIRMLGVTGRPRALSTAERSKLTDAGISEAIITALMEPPADVAPADTTPARTPAAPAPAAVRASAPAGPVTPFPPDLADVPSIKRRLAVQPFDYSTVMNWVTYWFDNPTNIGDGIRSMLAARMAQSNSIALLERPSIGTMVREQDLVAANRVPQGRGGRIGQFAGADAILMGDVVIFGQDDTARRRGVGAIIGRVSPSAGAVATMERSEKAVVGINLRIVDAGTGEVIETAEARGESSRSSKDYAGLLGGKGAAVGGASGMTSSNFQQTIIGEATSNAVTEVVKYLESRIAQLPARPRRIEGRVAVIGAGRTMTLAVGSEQGVLRGDRFEILQIDGAIRDPVTKEVIDIDAVKVGEFVADSVRGKTAFGAYGGRPLSTAVLTAAGRGYVARLVTK